MGWTFCPAGTFLFPETVSNDVNRLYGNSSVRFNIINCIVLYWLDIKYDHHDGTDDFYRYGRG